MKTYQCPICKIEIEYRSETNITTVFFCKQCGVIMDYVISEKPKDIITKIKDKLLQDALNRKILTPEEAEKYVGKYKDEFGFDSFINYLSYLIGVPQLGPYDIFLTLNKKMLADKDELEARFKLKIDSPGVVWRNMQDELSRRI